MTLDREANKEVRVDYVTVDGTAVAGRDYEPKSGTLVFGTRMSSVLVTRHSLKGVASIRYREPEVRDGGLTAHVLDRRTARGEVDAGRDHTAGVAKRVLHVAYTGGARHTSHYQRDTVVVCTDMCSYGFSCAELLRNHSLSPVRQRVQLQQFLQDPILTALSYSLDYT